MPQSSSDILEESAELNRLYNVVKTAFEKRNVSSGEREEWTRAANAFRSFQWQVETRWAPLRSPSIKEDLDLRDTAIRFLELNPMCFRSGYVKEDILRRLKSCPLTNRERARLNFVLRDAVLNRPYREYRRYCRLAACIAEPALIAERERLADATCATASRARMTLLMVRAAGRMCDCGN